MADKTLTDVVNAIKALEIAVLSVNPDTHTPIGELRKRQQLSDRQARVAMAASIVSVTIAVLALLVSAAPIVIRALSRSAPVFE